LKIIVTGGTGFVGYNLASRLIGMGHEVFVTGSPDEAGIPEGARLVGWAAAGAMEFDACMHQAANNDTMEGDLQKVMRANVFEPARLFNSLASKGCRKFVYASSAAVYGNGPAPYRESQEAKPLNPYAVSKLAFEEFAADFARETASSVIGLRYCNVYGPGESHKGRRSSMILQLRNQMASGSRPRIFRDGEQRRDWVYVDDAVEANVAGLESDKSGVFNVAGGRAVTFNYMVEVINRCMGTELEPEYIDCDFKDRFQTNTECDISEAQKVLGWRPSLTFEEGVEQYLSFLGSPL